MPDRPDNRPMTPLRLRSVLHSLLRFACLAAATLAVSAQAQPRECRPNPPEVARLVSVVGNFYSVDGPLAHFDPCHRSVDLSLPWGAERPPLMIVVHGGAGIDAATKGAVSAFRSAGFATLVFDAFEMNGFYQGPGFWSTSATNESRQRMIFKVALGAYEWARQQARIDTRRIVLHGLSNGGPSVLNVAALADPAHVRGVLAEGSPSAGIGLPLALKVPTRMVYGRLDNYGGVDEQDWMWTRTGRCAINMPSPEAAPGTATDCSRLVRFHESMPTPQAWYEARKAEGAPIEWVWLDETAHGAFGGPLTRRMVHYTNGNRRMAWVGGTSAARDQLVKLAKELVQP